MNNCVSGTGLPSNNPVADKWYKRQEERYLNQQEHRQNERIWELENKVTELSNFIFEELNEFHKFKENMNSAIIAVKK